LILTREFAGVVLIALTASTIVTLFIVGERANKDLEILENRYPSGIRQDQRNTFSLALIARKPVEDLRVQVGCLHLVPSENYEVEMGEFGRDALLSLESVRTLTQMSGRLGIDPVELEMKVIRNRTRQEMYLFDFTGLLPYVNESILGGYFATGITSIYAGVFNETGLAYLYAGSKDFFASRNGTITELSISLNDEKRTYRRIKELSSEEIKSGVPTLVDAPPLGTVEFEDLSKDDTVRIAFSVDRSSLPGGYGDGFEWVRIFVNGIPQTDLANFFRAA